MIFTMTNFWTVNLFAGGRTRWLQAVRSSTVSTYGTDMSFTQGREMDAPGCSCRVSSWHFLPRIFAGSAGRCRWKAITWNSGDFSDAGVWRCVMGTTSHGCYCSVPWPFRRAAWVCPVPLPLSLHSASPPSDLHYKSRRSFQVCCMSS